MAPNRSNRPFQLGINATAAGSDLRRVRLPTGSPSAEAAAAAQSGGRGIGDGKPQSQALQVYPWWERPPLGSLNYLAGSVLTASLANVAATELVVASKQCPNGYVWCVRGINIFVSSPTAAFNVKYILRANGTPVGDPYVTFGRVANSLEVPFSILEQGAGPTLLQLVAVNVDTGGPWSVAGTFTGWFTPSILADATGGLGA